MTFQENRIICDGVALAPSQTPPTAAAARKLTIDLFACKALRDAKADETARKFAMASKRQTILFQHSRGMSEARLVAIYGAEPVRLALHPLDPASEEAARARRVKQRQASGIKAIDKSRLVGRRA